MAIHAKGRYREAEPLLRRVLATRRRVLGEDHPNTATGYNNVAANLNAQGKYAEAEGAAVATARIYQTVRVQVAFSGLDRAEFGAKHSPLALAAAILARRAKPIDAWQQIEADLARGLFDDLMARRSRRLSDQERDREQTISRQLARLDEQIVRVEPAEGRAEAQKKEPAKAGTTNGDIRRERDRVILELKQFEQSLVEKYGVAAGTVYDLGQIQSRLPADAALVTWLDRSASPGAADPNGDHWAVIVRRDGPPTWVRLAGTGPDGAWTESDDELPDAVRSLLAATPTGPLDAATRQLIPRLAEQRLEPLEKLFASSRAGKPTANGGRQPPGDQPAHADRSPIEPVRHLVILPSRTMRGIPIEALSDRYTISYAPSGTMFAWLQEQREASVARAASGPMPKALALAEAKRWMRNLKIEERDRLVKDFKLSDTERGIGTAKDPGRSATAARPYEHPYYWSAFILIGDPL